MSRKEERAGGVHPSSSGAGSAQTPKDQAAIVCSRASSFISQTANSCTRMEASSEPGPLHEMAISRTQALRVCNIRNNGHNKTATYCVVHMAQSAEHAHYTSQNHHKVLHLTDRTKQRQDAHLLLSPQDTSSDHCWLTEKNLRLCKRLFPVILAFSCCQATHSALGDRWLKTFFKLRFLHTQKHTTKERTCRTIMLGK